MISVMFCFDQAMDRKEAKITYLFHIYPCLNIRQVLQFSVLLDVNIRVVVVMSNKDVFKKAHIICLYHLLLPTKDSYSVILQVLLERHHQRD